MRVRTLMTLAGVASLLAPVAALAGNPCIGDARQQLVESQAQCREDFQLAKDGCLNRDHECVDVCRANRGVCVEATGLEAAVEACNDTTREAKATCREQNPADSPALDACIDQAQVVGFQCRDAAREAARPALDVCRAEFRDCARACPPPNPPSEVADPVQCRRDAKATYKTCKTTAREDFQFQKDACKNRDHACVEQCRADRDACREPVESQLEASNDQCGAQRDGAVQNCRALYAEGSPEQDVCIDNAQVAAFQCRDEAHEEARPGFEGCNDGFRSCAEACPLAS